MSDLKTQLAKRAQNDNGQGITLSALVKQDAIKARFQELLGQKAPGFLASVLNVVNNNSLLKECNPQEILSQAAIAATLDLPINPNLGFAYIVPYKEKGGTPRPQFQLGYRGYIQLAMRTGLYKTINATHVFEGEIESYNRITGEVVFSQDGAKSDKIVGYIAYFKLINGFEKFEYWPLEKVRAHAKRFSQSYRSGTSSPWQTDFDAMATKTVLKSLLHRYGILSIEMQTAIQADQATVIEREDGSVEYEYPDHQTVEAEYSITNDEATEQAPPSNDKDEGLPFDADDPLAPDPRGF